MDSRSGETKSWPLSPRETIFQRIVRCIEEGDAEGLSSLQPWARKDPEWIDFVRLRTAALILPE